MGEAGQRVEILGAEGLRVVDDDDRGAFERRFSLFNTPQEAVDGVLVRGCVSVVAKRSSARAASEDVGAGAAVGADRGLQGPGAVAIGRYREGVEPARVENGAGGGFGVGVEVAGVALDVALRRRGGMR